MRRDTFHDGQLVNSEEIPDPKGEPTLDDRLAAIEKAITKGADYAAMKADLAASDVSAVDVKPAQPTPKK